jgi:hypothetical protein
VDQITATYKLFNLLRRLSVIGIVKVETIATSPKVEVLSCGNVAVHSSYVYGLRKLGYESRKGISDTEELLESIFGRPYTGSREYP